MKKAFIICAVFALTLIPISQTSAYSLSGHHWDYGNPRYVSVTISSSVPSAWNTAIARGMSAWNNAGAKFRFNAGYDNHAVSFRNLYSHTILAATYIREGWNNTRITDRDTDINSQFSWDVNADPNKFDVQNTMAHEFGHWLDLNDLYNPGDYWATMYGISFPGNTYQRTLVQDDINGIRAIYR